MVYQMPFPGKARMFAASSAELDEQARLELEHWASSNGYQIAKADCIYTVYAAAQTPRQWILLERADAEGQPRT